MDLSSEEMVGTLVVIGIPVLKGLRSSSIEERAWWGKRIPRMVRPFCSIKWFMAASPSNETILREALEEVRECYSNKFVWKGTAEENKGVERAFGEILPIVDGVLKGRH